VLILGIDGGFDIGVVDFDVLALFFKRGAGVRDQDKEFFFAHACQGAGRKCSVVRKKGRLRNLESAAWILAISSGVPTKRELGLISVVTPPGMRQETLMSMRLKYENSLHEVKE
jgi:hypothetical protein